MIVHFITRKAHHFCNVGILQKLPYSRSLHRSARAMSVMDTKLSNLLEEYWQWRLEESPEFASTLGLHQKDDKLDSFSEESYCSMLKKCESFKKNLSGIDVKLLSAKNQLNLTLFEDSLNSIIDGYQWRKYSTFNPPNFLENPPLDFESYLIDAMVFKSKVDFEKYISRLESIPKQMDEQIGLMKEAVKNKTTNHAVSINGYMKKLESLLATPVEQLALMKPLREDLESVSDMSTEDRTSLRMKAEDILKNKVNPAFRCMLKYLEEDYQTRPDFGVSSLKDGHKFYATCLKWHTTTDLTPEEVHALGLTEVARIRGKMNEVKDSVNFSGSLDDFFKHLKEDPQFYHKNAQDLLGEFKEIINDVIPPFLNDFFDEIPEAECVVKEMPFNGPGGMYINAPIDNSKPGTFLANLYEPETKPRFSMMSLCLHEACPGHHFQFSYLNNQKMPDFRKQFDFRKCHSVPCHFPLYTAYVEGWALYTEYLGEEMGAYRSPYELFGRYSDEMFRAARLVVDTGLHVYGWSHEQAVAFLKENTCVPEVEIMAEVDRYITWPGQACSYKIGELKIKELRHRAEQKLGSAFDIKKFHSTVLRVGPVPLNVLEDAVDSMIAQQLQS